MMSPKGFLVSILDDVFQFEGGERFKISLKPAYTEEEVVNFEMKLPGKLPEDIKELLLFARGFTFDVLRDVNFDDLVSFQLNGVFDCPLMLCDDEVGNCWVVDIEKNGRWGNIFFVSKDPPVIVKEADNLTSFLSYLVDFGKDYENSQLHKTMNEIVYDIWTNEGEFIKANEASKINDAQIRDFAKTVSAHSIIYDFRDAPNGKGFAWGKFGNKTRITRHKTEQLFAIQEEKNAGFWERIRKLFGFRKEK